MSDPVRASFEKLRREAMAKQESETDRALTRINEQVEELDIRWTDDRLREALAPVIASSIREAGRKQPEAVARAMSPHVIGTVRTEIKNSEEAIIDVLHPRLGRLIRQGIATAVDELRQQVDEALPLDRWIADMKARLTGAPRLGALLKDPSPFIIYEAYLIERRSGRLLAREVPRDIEAGEGADEDLFAGMIAALDSFARDALAEEGGGTLRRIETDAGSLYLRASATRIIALRTTGNPVPDIEQRMDLFLETLLEQAGEDGDTVAAFDTTPLLQGPEASAGAGGAAATTGAFGLIARGVGAIAAVICAINGHALIEEHRRDRAVEAVASVLDEAPAYLGYPLSAGFAPARDEVLVRGLAPDEAAREALLARLAEVPLAFPLVTQVPVAGRRLEP